MKIPLKVSVNSTQYIHMLWRIIHIKKWALAKLFKVLKSNLKWDTLTLILLLKLIFLRLSLFEKR